MSTRQQEDDRKNYEWHDGVLSNEAMTRKRREPGWEGEMHIAGSRGWKRVEPDDERQFRKDMEARNYYKQQSEREEEDRKAMAQEAPMRGAALIRDADAKERDVKRLKQKQEQGLASTKPFCTAEAAYAAREHVYAAFLHANQTVGEHDEWDDINKEYHSLMKKLDYNRSRMNQTQDLALEAVQGSSEFEALQRKYTALAGRNLGDYWTQLRALRGRFSTRQHAVEAALNEWRQAVLAASQVLGIHIIELQNSMQGFAEAHAAELEQRHGVFAPYADAKIATG